ncbi:MAG: ABC transporter permease subunit, partial [Treponema sp.]|nr:ABC transporter permease subunit [Treponema sp.]
PALVARTLLRLAADGSLQRHTWVSFARVAGALVASGVPALVLGLAAGRSAAVNRIVSPVVYLLHPLPKAAFLPIIMLFFGIGETAKIFLVAFVVFSQMLVAVRDTVRQVSAEHLDVVRSMGAGRLGLLRHVVIPAALPGLFSAFRVSLGTAIAVLFISETFVSQNGLGHLVMDAWIRMSFSEMYAAITALSLLGLLLFIITDVAEFVLCPWNRREE